MFKEKITPLGIIDENTVRISIPGDGNCFFHSILRAFNKTYISSNIYNRKMQAKKLRKKLADCLDEETYLSLSNGLLPQISKEVPQASRRRMLSELRSSSFVGNLYHELISNVLDKNIYFIDLKRRDIYVTGDDIDLLYKNRPNILLLTIPGHYEVVGLKIENEIFTIFDNNHPLIIRIREIITSKSQN
jgi:hypothetical protein